MQQKLISHQVNHLKEKVIAWRREFHRYPEVGWTEFRTSARIADILTEMGFEVKVGSEVIKKESRMGVPDTQTLVKAKEQALKKGANPRWIEKMEEGLTGVVGIWDTKQPGPTIAFRFDIDALNIVEDQMEDHIPFREGFCSEHEGVMHACGHDGHTAIGLGMASLIFGLKESLIGKVKLIFQPAEEGVRGAKAMVDAGVLDGIDYFFSGHLGVKALKEKQIVCGVTDFFATTKMDVSLEGIPAHAGLAPHEGRNALLAAATITLQLHAIARHGDGQSRINVGTLQAGEGRNIIPSNARLQLETRGTTNEVNQYMVDEALRIIHSAAQMYGVKAHVEFAGQAVAAQCDSELVDWIGELVKNMERVDEVISTLSFNASEDATYMMERVQSQGGKASYLLFGTPLKAGHHHYSFDLNEDSCVLAVEVLGNILFRIASTIN
jgi:aminobenzoyl-glutamate utilization protein A